MQYTSDVNTGAISRSHFCRWKTTCVCGLNYQAWKPHARYYIVLCNLSGSTMFSVLSLKRHYFWKKLLNIKYAFDPL